MRQELWWVDMEQKAYLAWRQKIYNRKAWKQCREYVLDKNPLCVICELEKRLTPAVDVDHIKPLFEIFVSGDHVEAYNVENLRGLCKQCHTRKTVEDREKRKQNLKQKK